jgi:hypothetical protein
MSGTEYNGWTNWETWNTNLWMTNDEGAYETAREIVAPYITEADLDDAPSPRSVDAYRAGKALREWWDEVAGPENRGTPLADAWGGVMSEVNWSEIAEALAEE